MTSDPSYERILTAAQDTFAQGDYETACHSLMAALERARYLQDSEAITSIERIASEHLATLNRITLSARFAGERGIRQQSLKSLYSSTLQQCSTWKDLVEHWQRRKAHPPSDVLAPKRETDQEVSPAGGQS